MRDPRERGAVLGAVAAAGAALLRLPRWAFALAAIAWAALIWALSARAGQPGAGHWAWNYAENLGHAFLFGVLALWMALAVPRRDSPFPWSSLGGANAAAVFALALAWGAVDEWHQSRVPNRCASALDLVTDVAGIAAVLAIARYAGREGARERTAQAILALGFAACCASAFLATALPG
jgi:VanZ family protein